MSLFCFRDRPLVPGLAAALLIALFASAPGKSQARDCTRTSQRPVVGAICADDTLRHLDAEVDERVQQLARQSAAATADAQPAIVRDQANWWAETLATGWAAIHDKQPIRDALGERYHARLAYLRARQAPAPRDPVLRTLQAALGQQTTNTEAGDDKALASLSDNQHIRPGRNAGTAELPAAVFKQLGVSPVPALQAGVADTFGERAVTWHWLAEARLGVLSRREGSAGCFANVWFAADDKQMARAVPSPSALATPGEPSCDTAAPNLAMIDDQAVLLRIDNPSVDERVLRIQPWTGTAWQPARRLVARYDHRLGPARVVHRADSSDGFWQTLAAPLAEAFDQRPVPGFLAPALSPRNAARLNRVRRQIIAASGDAPYMTAPLTGDTTGQPIGAYTQFGADAVFFPVATEGQWLLGRIGHGHVGWRADSGWLLGFWTFDADDNLVPLASVGIPRVRGALLGSAVLAGPGQPN